MKRVRRWLAIGALLLGAGIAAPSWALSAGGEIRDFRRTVWCERDGAPVGIGPIVQGADGYLWLGTLTSGVVRFDGRRFERFDFPRDDRIPSTGIMRVFAPREGGLWMGFTRGGLGYLKDGQTTFFPNAEGMPRGNVASLGQGPDGTLWVGTTAGLWRRDGTGWAAVGPERGLPKEVVTSILFDAAGTLWISVGSRILSLAPGAPRFEERAAVSGDPLVQAPSGDIWARPTGSAVWQRIHRAPAGSKVEPAISRHIGMAFDRSGAMWVKFPGSLRRIPDPGSRADSDVIKEDSIPDAFDAQDGLSPPLVGTTMLVDREDNVWLNSGDCMERFAEANVRQVVPSRKTARLDLSYASAAIAAADDGGIWIAHSNDEATWRHDAPSTFTRFPQAVRVWGSHRGRDGSVWFIGDGETWRTWRYSGGRFSAPSASPLTSNRLFGAVNQDAQGRLWMGSADRMVRLSGARWEDVPASEVPRPGPNVMHTDARGRIWFGYMDGQVGVLDGAGARMLAGDQSPAIGAVAVISSRGDRVWFGGTWGIAMFDGERFHTISPTTAGPIERITGIVESANGDLWLSNTEGIVHMTAQARAAAFREPTAQPEVELFAAADGIKGAVIPDGHAQLVEGTDGRIWLSSTGGVYVLDPARLRRNAVPPIVHVSGITLDGTTVVPTDGMALPANTSGLRITYAGLSLTAAEKVRYRYQLVGVDAGWQEAGARNEVFYSGLAPGDYRFRVVASNNDGVWNEAGATLNFSIPPTFTQTRWFIALCVLGVLLVGWGVLRIRVRQVASRLRARLEARQAERERIARELHDTLLQSTQGLILRFQAAADAMDANQPARRMLEDTLQRADEVMAEGRDRVVSLRATGGPAQGLAADLREALADEAEGLARGHATTLQVHTDGTTRALDAKVQDEVVRIAREAMSNALSHAQATTLDVRITYRKDLLHVSVRDDGLGMDASTLANGKPRHWGLRGMRERAQGIGGELRIRSEPGSGTDVELSVPAAKAYARTRGRLMSWRS